MATVTSIATAIATQMDALSFVDRTSINEYVPAAMGSTCVCLITPFSQETGSDYSSFGDTVTLRHTLSVEFWVQIKNGAVATAMQIARDAGYLAIVKLLDKDGTGYTLDRAINFQERITPEPVTVANVPWVICVLRVPVENEVSF
jgi:hypothetical protein